MLTHPPSSLILPTSLLEKTAASTSNPLTTARTPSTMRFNFLSTLPILLSLTSFAQVVSASANATLSDVEKRTYGWEVQKCANVQGNWGHSSFNFGCLCLDDLDDFCSNNAVNKVVAGLLRTFINTNGKTNEYPPNSQPTCQGGGYSCGSLTKRPDGTCGQTNCPPRTCSTNGGCCPRGQTYKNGKCCGSVGCKRNGQVCTPVFQCPTYQSNGICCASGTSGWIGQDTICCPSGQVEKNGKCECPTGQKKKANNPNQCESTCTNGHSFCKSRCCPPGADEDNKGQCVCKDSQQKLEGTGPSAKCVNKCTGRGFIFQKTRCCPPGATENASGQCVCPKNQNLQGNGDNAKCVDKCDGGNKWCHSTCCKPYMDENDKGKCVCTSPGFVDNGRACVPKCPSKQKYNPNTGNCDDICDEAAGYFYKQGWKNNGLCCKKSYSACNNVCCPPGTEEVGNSHKCCPKGSTLDPKGDCLAPTKLVVNPKRDIYSAGKQIQLNGPSTAFTYGMEENRDHQLCPMGLAACPIEGRQAEDYECLDTSSDLQSCGGCASLGSGLDCTQLPGAKWMGCNVGVCEVYSCQSGWVRSEDGKACVKIASGHRRR